MHERYEQLLIASGFVAIAVICTLGSSSINHYAKSAFAGIESAAVFFVPSITINDLRTLYDGSRRQLSYADKTVSQGAASSHSKAKLRILIVPGHEPDSGGTEFHGIFERDLVVEAADDLAALLRANDHYEVSVARSTIDWNPALKSYFAEHAADIAAFREDQTAQMKEMISEGKITTATDQVEHNYAPDAAALDLYGINKWASDNDIDLTIHLHINDYGGRPAQGGVYHGFAIYVPDAQYSNAAASRAVGEAIAGRLKAYHAVSTLPLESKGVIDDQELIAIGSNNSADSASVLIELGYIYEPQFQNVSVRPLALSDYAYEIYLGLQDFFHDPVSAPYGSTAFPYDWSTVTIAKGVSGPGIYALQAALHYLRAYPPSGESLADCPISGRAGDCTVQAVMEYQKSNGIEASGVFGPQTRAALGAALR